MLQTFKQLQQSRHRSFLKSLDQFQLDDASLAGRTAQTSREYVIEQMSHLWYSQSAFGVEQCIVPGIHLAFIYM